MAFERYLYAGGKKLRCGYTTGTCAALAAQAATTALFGGVFPQTARLLTPQGIPVEATVMQGYRDDAHARCAIEKDAGDDTDATDGLLIFAEICLIEGTEIRICGGEGVGRVTRPGLEQPVGEAAINSVPRAMIAREVREVCDAIGYAGGLEVTISIPRGEEIAKKTFNPHLGIVGGLSILGTTGIVEPQSVQALVDTIEAEMKVLAAEGVRELVITPGNYGEAFLQSHPELASIPRVKCSNYIGDTLDFAAMLGYRTLLLVGHVGKFAKLAGGIMNTHSRMADGRAEIIAAYAALAGASRNTIAAIMGSATTDAAIDALEGEGLREATMQGILSAAQRHVMRRVGDEVQVGVVLFSNQHGLLGVSEQGRVIMNRWRREHE